jgi:hypothetical protein
MYSLTTSSEMTIVTRSSRFLTRTRLLLTGFCLYAATSMWLGMNRDGFVLEVLKTVGTAGVIAWGPGSIFLWGLTLGTVCYFVVESSLLVLMLRRYLGGQGKAKWVWLFGIILAWALSGFFSVALSV